MSDTDDYIPERVLGLGEDGHLVAIASDPPFASQRPAVLLLNAGVLHRVGPHRLHVHLARRLAAAGFPSVRLDLSGIGDSRPIAGGLAFRASAVADVRTTMDYLAAEGHAGGFVLFGICSGADNAQATALADPRVLGVVLVDPAAYTTPRARLRRTWARIRRDGMFAWLGRMLRGAQRRVARPASEDNATQGGRQAPPAAQFGAELEQLVARGVRLLNIYSGALGTRYNHAGQLFEVFPALRGQVDVAYFPQANHTFTELDAQQRLLACVLEWTTRQFAPPRS
jgi:pimeloyl-ACP methyl ester carboxylesterase